MLIRSILQLIFIFPMCLMFLTYICSMGTMWVITEAGVHWKQDIPRKKKENIAHILGKETHHARKGQYNRYLFQWEGLTPIESTRIIEGNLLNLDVVKWQKFEDNHF